MFIVETSLTLSLVPPKHGEYQTRILLSAFGVGLVGTIRLLAIGLQKHNWYCF